MPHTTTPETSVLGTASFSPSMPNMRLWSRRVSALMFSFLILGAKCLSTYAFVLAGLATTTIFTSGDACASREDAAAL